jgi:hypothetical protein
MVRLDPLRFSWSAHLVAAQLHARQVIPLDVQLTARWYADRPRVDGSGELCQVVSVLRHLRLREGSGGKGVTAV